MKGFIKEIGDLTKVGFIKSYHRGGCSGCFFDRLAADSTDQVDTSCKLKALLCRNGIMPALTNIEYLGCTEDPHGDTIWVWRSKSEDGMDAVLRHISELANIYKIHS